MATRKIGNIEFTNVNLLLIIDGIICSIFCSYVFYWTYQSDRNLISIMIIPLILGIIYENRKLSTDWKTISLKILGSIFLSIFAFLPGKNEKHYDFENHIEGWPYCFVFFFVLISTIYHNKKVIPKLTEGITFLQSISIIYWIIDLRFLNIKNIFTFILIGLGLIFSFISFIHAFSYLKLTKKVRLFLSIWSSIIMIIFAIDHINRVFNFNSFSNYQLFDEALCILQYFLLGISLIYIFKNASMLFVYFPDKNSPYGKEQMKDIKQMNKTHIDRYSEEQIKILDSLFALLFTSGLYYLNLKHQIMPRHTLIWLVFFGFPLLISLKNVFFKKLA